MAHTVTWEGRTQDFDTEEEAKAAARSMKGIVLVNHKPSGSVTTFRDGRELEGTEATEATRSSRTVRARDGCVPLRTLQA